MLAWFASFFVSLWYSLFLAGGAVLFLAALFLKPILGGMTGGASALAPSWAVGPLRIAGKFAGGCLMLYGGWNLAILQHDAGMIATWAAAQRIEVDAAVEAERLKGNVATIAAADAARAGALADAPVREVIRRVPVQMACVANPGIASAVRSMRLPAGAGAGAGPAAPRVP